MASVLATCSTSSMTFRIGGLSPTILSTADQLVDGLAQLHIFLPQTPLLHRAATRWLSSSGSTGLVT